MHLVPRKYFFEIFYSLLEALDNMTEHGLIRLKNRSIFGANWKKIPKQYLPGTDNDVISGNMITKIAQKPKT